MRKTIKTFSTNINLYETFEQVVGKGNVSKVITQMMENYVGAKKNPTDLDKIKEKYEKTQQKTTEMAAELEKIRTEMLLAEQKHQEALQKAKAEAEELAKKSRKCTKCGEPISNAENSINYAKGIQFHKGCYLTIEKEELKRIKDSADQGGT